MHRLTLTGLSSTRYVAAAFLAQIWSVFPSSILYISLRTFTVNEKRCASVLFYVLLVCFNWTSSPSQRFEMPDLYSVLLLLLMICGWASCSLQPVICGPQAESYILSPQCTSHSSVPSACQASGEHARILPVLIDPTSS